MAVAQLKLLKSRSRDSVIFAEFVRFLHVNVMRHVIMPIVYICDLLGGMGLLRDKLMIPYAVEVTFAL